MDAVLQDRFETDLARLLPEGGRIGVAVSGGPDSLALLLLASAVRPGEVEAATVDHRLRPESADEARMVAEVCAGLKVRHATLAVDVPAGASLQAQARTARYLAIGRWAERQGLAAVLTGHHADDQAETLLMRLARGSGLSGLAGVRERRRLGDSGNVLLVRPLLRWRKAELMRIVSDAGLSALEDPANSDPRHDRTAARAWLARPSDLDPLRLGASAAHLAEAEEALAYATEWLFSERGTRESGGLLLTAGDLPAELQRRLVLRGMAELGTGSPRGADLGRALEKVRSGGRCTVSGLLLTGGERWRLQPEPPRR